MILYPAIDILNGKAVRLFKGDYSKMTIYDEDILSVARKFIEQGAQWLHCVDLDAARTGKSVNKVVIQKLIENVDIPIQLGGGIRSVEEVEMWLKLGVSRVIIGTTAIKHPKIFIESCIKFPNKVAIALDVKNNKLMSDGWQESSTISPQAWLSRISNIEIAAIIITDISRDGTLVGPNWQLSCSVANRTSVPVIVSGGVGSLQDLADLNSYPQLSGMILGKALYEGCFTLGAALAEIESGG